MKSKTLFLIVLVLNFSFIVVPVFAEDSVRDVRPTFRSERQENKQENKEDRQEARETITQAHKTIWTEVKKKQIRLSTTRIQTELQLRYDILQKFKTKIGERIAKKSVDYDTTAAATKFAQFSDTQYQTDLKDFNTKITALTSSTTPRDLMPGIRDAANIVRKDIRDLHLFLVEVMKLVATSPKKP